MAPTPEMAAKINSLQQELNSAIEHYRRLAVSNYRFALALMIVTLIASALAGLGGIFFGFGAKLTGGIALLPGITALIGSVLKPQGRANWHYKKKDALNALRRRLLYELPESPSPDNVAAISNDWASLDKQMNEEWERNYILDWSSFAKGKEGNGH